MNISVLEKLRNAIRQHPEKQYKIAEKLGITAPHLSRVLSGDKPLTQRLAKKITGLNEFNFNEQELLYPHLELTIAGFFHVNKKVQTYNTSRPSLYVPTPIKENYFGVIFRGHDNNSAFNLKLNEGECMVFDGWFEKHKEIDQSYLGKMNIIECPKNELYVGWLDEKSSKTGKYGFCPLGTSAWQTCHVLWASTFIMAWNLAKLEGVDKLIQLD